MVTLAVVGVAGTLVVALRSRGDESYRVAAVFDNAKGMVGGQQVKIAGAVVGKVEEVRLARGYKARVTMSVDRRFAPFHRDARCTILPQGLISENFIQCDPGSEWSPLSPGSGGIPTVAVQRTTAPLSLQDALNVFSMPTDQRLRILFNELGVATAGRGAQLNAVLRRVNPALTQSRRALSVVDAQRERLATAVGQTDHVLSRLAGQDDRVRAFVDRAAILSRTTADHRAALGEAVQRLPAMLDAVRPGLRSLSRAANDASPLLDDLRASAPGLRSLTSTLPSFARAGVPAVRAVASAAARGRPAVRAARPVVTRLKTAAGKLAPLAGDLGRLLVDTRDRGGIEGILKVTYAFANNTSLYDDVSHILTFQVAAAPLCIAGQQAERDVKGCARKYSAPGKGTLPINDPSCGPKDASWWDERCPNPTPGPLAGMLPSTQRRGAADRARLRELGSLVDRGLTGGANDPERLRALLDYLLK